MTLAEYIEGHTTYRALAKRVGVTASQLCRIANGRKGYSPQVADAIVAATGGKVTLEDLAAPLRARRQQEAA